MKTYIALLIPLLFSINLIAQTPKIKIRKKTNDTLSNLQGTWQFEFISILNKNKSAENYFATELIIDSTKFIMRLSEAAESGRIISTNNRIKFIFDTKYCKDTSWCKDLVIYQLDKKHLVLLKKQAKTENYFTKQKGYQDILFYYKK